VLKDGLVNDSAKVVRIGDKEVLFALREELIEDTRVQEGIVKITVTRGVPVLLVIVGALGAGKESLLEDPWVS